LTASSEAMPIPKSRIAVDWFPESVLFQLLTIRRFF
jgi:hypothetical protein